MDARRLIARVPGLGLLLIGPPRERENGGGGLIKEGGSLRRRGGGFVPRVIILKFETRVIL